VPQRQKTDVCTGPKSYIMYQQFIKVIINIQNRGSRSASILFSRFKMYLVIE